MSHVNRKAKSFEQIKAEQEEKTGGDAEHMVEIEPGVFVDDRKIDFVKPNEEELLKLAGGSLDMVNTGKQGMELRSILAQRVSYPCNFLILLSVISLKSIFIVGFGN